METGRVHDRALLDALEASETRALDLDVWRITLSGRDPLRGSTAAGRWNPGASEVLYTSVERDGALAEIGFRLALEPVWPSRIAHEAHHIKVATERTLHFADVNALAGFGIDPVRYSGFDYAACQALSAAAHFLEFDGLLVPSARHSSQNLVIFMDRSAATSLELRISAPVDWTEWRAQRRG
jgi:RES domain-containing protein